MQQDMVAVLNRYVDEWFFSSEMRFWKHFQNWDNNDNFFPIDHFLWNSLQY
jgi:hypothetical protein